MTFFADIAPALIGAGGSVVGGLLSGGSQPNPETKMQKTQRKLIDRLLASLNGEGEFADLYSSDEGTFQKSFVEPAQAMFRNQIAPQIQQQYIAGGQQRGTGLDDTLTRAGVDLDSMLNSQMYQFQQDALNRKQNTIGSILSAGAGAPNQASTGQDAMGALGGYLSSTDFADQAKNFFNTSNNPASVVPREGFKS
jgi:hypothetical protein